MRQQFAVEMDDGSEYKVQADGRDIRAYEAASGQSFLTTQFTYTQMTNLAAHAAIREGRWDGSAEEFVEHNISVQIDGPGERLDPTPRGVTANSSSPSLSAPGSGRKPGTKQARKQ